MANKYKDVKIGLINPSCVGAGGYEGSVELGRYLDTCSRMLRTKAVQQRDFLQYLALSTGKSFGWWGKFSALTLLPHIEHDPWPAGYAPKLPPLTVEILRSQDRSKAETKALYLSPAGLGVGGRFMPAFHIEEWVTNNLPFLREYGTKQYLVEYIHQLRYLMTLPCRYQEDTNDNAREMGSVRPDADVAAVPGLVPAESRAVPSPTVAESDGAGSRHSSP